MELKSEVDAIGINLARNLINTFRASHNTIRKVIHDAQEITDHKKVNNHIFSFYKKLFEGRLLSDSKKLLEILKDIPIPSLTGEKL